MNQQIMEKVIVILNEAYMKGMSCTNSLHQPHSSFHSGYGSGAVSSTTLSEDSLSMQSVSVDETPDKDVPAGVMMDISTLR